MGRVSVGWVVADTLGRRWRPFWSLPTPVKMRVANVARWLNVNDQRLRSEPYRRSRRYDVVVFFKTMDRTAQDEARRIQQYGGRVVFDANVNYYETWGDYEIQGTRPTPEQQGDARAMTVNADWVVADSSYLLGVVRTLTDRASFVPDNVDARWLRGARRHEQRTPVRLVWSGMAEKAEPFVSVLDAWAGLGSAELVLVAERPPRVLADLREVLPTSYERFSERRYARTLRGCDVIVAPRRLVNAYEAGHTEWKITLGMAAGLPAVASPQQSYVEAIGHRGGGIVADTTEEWREALMRLVGDASLRSELGARARETVVERYATPVVARQYGDILLSLAE